MSFCLEFVKSTESESLEVLAGFPDAEGPSPTIRYSWGMAIVLGLIFVGVVLIAAAVRSSRVHIALRIGLGTVGIILIGLAVLPWLDVWFGHVQLS